MLKLKHLMVALLCAPVSADVATFFQYPVPKGEYNCEQGPFLGKYVNPQNITKYHLGEDWNRVGGGDYMKPLYACAAGQVVDIDDFPNNIPDDWGKVISMIHTLPDGSIVYSTYAHLYEIFVHGDQVITEEDIDSPIGLIGDAGGTYPPHLHFEIRTSPWDNGNPYTREVTWESIEAYYSPSLFISNRQQSNSWDLPKNRWEYIYPNFTSIGGLSYLRSANQFYSVYEAGESGIIYPKIRFQGEGQSGSINNSNYFGMPFYPPISYGFKANVRNLELVIWAPSFTAIRDLAQIDMIFYALNVNDIVSFLPDTFKKSNINLDPSWWFWEMKYRRSGNRIGTFYQATNRTYPVTRYVTYKGSESGDIADWVSMTNVWVN